MVVREWELGNNGNFFSIVKVSVWANEKVLEINCGAIYTTV